MRVLPLRPALPPDAGIVAPITNRTRIRAVLLFLLLTPCALQRAMAAVAPVSMFYKSFAYPVVVLSPSGRYFAALYPSNGTTNLAVVDVATDQGHPLTDFRRPTEVTEVAWDNEDRLVYGFDSMSRIGLRLHSLAAVNRDGTNPLMLVDNAGSATSLFENALLVDGALDDPRSVLVASDADKLDFPAVYKVDTLSPWHAMQNSSTQERNRFPTLRELLVKPPGRHCTYLADHVGTVRLCTTLETDGSRQILYRDDDKSEWGKITGFSSDSRVVEAIGFMPDNRRLYVLSNRDRDTIALFEMDPKTGTLGNLIYEAPSVDISYPVWSSDRRTLLGVSYHTSSWHTHYFDPNVAHVVDGLQGIFPDQTLKVMNFSQDRKQAIVLVTSNLTAGGYYLFDANTGKVRSLAPLAPWIDPKQLSPVQPIHYAARDGLMIDGYLTVPRGKAPQHLPLIVDPHGGPTARDTGGWDPDVQFFASRGYAVLQMNFRGSYGSGTKFREAGNREWGGKMLDDVVDAVAWAEEQGIADPKRVCIFGASYGGYAALMAAATRPDMFRCAISYAGVTDLESVFQPSIVGEGWVAERPPEQIVMLTRVIGDRRDADFLREHSPVYNAAKIECPVFIAHGRQDSIVSVKDARRMRDALQKAGKKVEYVEKPDEGHGFANEENRIDLFTRIDAFLKKHDPAD
jgi:dipeptidyl aminopeptidase/acylaminoacyl peptidase